MGAFPIEKREDPPHPATGERGAIKHTRGKKNSSKNFDGEGERVKCLLYP